MRRKEGTNEPSRQQPAMRIVGHEYADPPPHPWVPIVTIPYRLTMLNKLCKASFRVHFKLSIDRLRNNFKALSFNCEIAQFDNLFVPSHDRIWTTYMLKCRRGNCTPELFDDYVQYLMRESSKCESLYNPSNCAFMHGSRPQTAFRNVSVIK